MLRSIAFTVNFVQKRFIKREIQQKLKEKRSAKNLALDYFDFFYAPLYGVEWPKIRLALLTGRKYTALVNNYSINRNETINDLTKLGAFNLFEICMRSLEKHDNVDETATSSVVIDRKQIKELKIPTTLNVFCFDNGNASEFPSPSPDSNRKSSLFFFKSDYYIVFF